MKWFPNQSVLLLKVMERDLPSRFERRDYLFHKRQENDFNLLDNTMTELVLEMMGELSYLDPKTHLLSNFLIALNKSTKDKRRKVCETRKL